MLHKEENMQVGMVQTILANTEESFLKTHTLVCSQAAFEESLVLKSTHCIHLSKLLRHG